MFKERQCLTWDEVRRLHAGGISFGSHTVTHPVLHRLSWSDIRRELRDSRAELEAALDVAVTAFAYPYAFPQEDREFARRFRQELIDQGYSVAATTVIGRARPGGDLLCVPRLPVNESDDWRLLIGKLNGAYDWLGRVQLVSRRLKAILKMTDAYYVVITPVRDEAAHVGATIDSMVSQTLRPLRWIIVDDGSTDGTASIVDKAAKSHPWILVIHRPDRGKRVSGGGVVEAFNEGYELIREQSWTFIVKLDADLTFDREYFAQCLQRFADDPRLGIGGGTVCVANPYGLEVETPSDPPFHVRGATKIYRRECWQEIEPLIVAPGWDTLDEVKANMKGWSTRTFHDLHVIQRKQTGEADGCWRNSFKNGRANYIVGYDPLFMFLKCVKRSFGRPLLIDGLGLAAGFCTAYVRGLPQATDRRLIRYLRAQQRRRLLFRQSIYS
jgi:glycosyltransferase involved in cell wall biosynthesis